MEKIGEFFKDRRRVLAIAGGVFVLIIFLFMVFSPPKGQFDKDYFLRLDSSSGRRIIGFVQKSSVRVLEKIGLKKVEKKIGKGEAETGLYLKSESYTKLKKDSLFLIAQEIANYIKSQKREDGFYNYSYIQNSDGSDVDVYETTNAWTALSYIAANNILENKEYLNLAQKDIENLQKWCFNKPGQCSWVLVQPAKLYQKTKDPKLLAFLKKEGEILLVNSDKSLEGFMLRSIEVRELALLYEITKDSRYLAEARSRYSSLIQEKESHKKLYENNIASYPVEGCWYSLASLEVAKNIQAGEADLYINNAKDLLSKAVISDFFPLFPHPIEIQPCIESYFELYKLTGDIKYFKQGNDYLSRFISVFWDGEEKPKIYGKGGTIFMSRSKVFKKRQDRLVVLTDSAYTLYLLSLALGG